MAFDADADLNKSRADFDVFLDDATHAIHELWTESSGRELTMDELYQINEWIEGFFVDKRATSNDQ